MHHTFRNLVRNELQRATKWLADSNPETGIHEARRSLKRLRAALRLMRTQLDGELFHTQNGVWRESARKLSPLRDQIVVLRTFDKIRKWNEDYLLPGQWLTIRALLAKEAKQVSRGRTLTSLKAKLTRGVAGVDAWVPEAIEAATLKDGLRETYRKGRRAGRIASADPNPVHLHDLRKQVNYLRYQILLLGELNIVIPETYLERVDRLVKRLGVNNDLVILSAAIDQLAVPDNQRKLLNGMINDRSERIVTKALDDAGSVYQKRSRDFVKEFL